MHVDGRTSCRGTRDEIRKCPCSATMERANDADEGHMIDMAMRQHFRKSHLAKSVSLEHDPTSRCNHRTRIKVLGITLSYFASEFPPNQKL